MPNVLTAEMLKKLDLPTDKFNASFEAMMRAGKERLLALQHPTGGWGWFEHDAEDPFMTACAVHGLGECDRLGYPVDSVALKRGRDRLRAMAKAENDLNRLAYEAYVLGEEFDRLLERSAELSPYAQALLALALHKANRDEAPGVAQKLVAAANGDHWETANWYYKWDNVSIETTCYAIQALVALDPKNPLIPKATSWLLAQRQAAGRWRSTKDTAVAIATLLQVSGLERLVGILGEEPSESKPQGKAFLKKIGVTLNGADRCEILADLNDPTHSVFETRFTAPRSGPNVLRFEKLDEQSDFKFDVEVTQRLFEERVAAESRGLGVEVKTDRPLDRLQLGDEVTVTVAVTAAEAADYVMIQSPVPAGCEVIRGSGTGPFARFEDRYEKAIFFLRSLGGETVKFTYRMRCAYAGRFTVLPASATLMYNEEIYGVSAPGAARIEP